MLTSFSAGGREGFGPHAARSDPWQHSRTLANAMRAANVLGACLHRTQCLPPLPLPQLRAAPQLISTQQHAASRGLAAAAGAESAEPEPTGASWRDHAKKLLLIPAAAAAAFAGTTAAAQDGGAQSEAWAVPLPASWKRGEVVSEGDGAVALTHSAIKLSTQLPPWAHRLAASGVLHVLDKDMLETNSHPMLSDDHMFSELVRVGMITDLASFYAPSTHPGGRKFYTVVQLGRNTCGFKRVTHGGMTAAIMDETLGGLFLALKESDALPFRGPAFTAALEVQYKARLPGGATVLCTCEVESIEGRKVWMRATVSDGPEGKVFATSRALFVAPKPHKLLKEITGYLWHGLTLSWAGNRDTATPK